MNAQAVTLGRTVRRIRTQKKITQKELGQLMGWTRQNVWRLEEGQHIPTLQTLVRVCEALEIRLSVLLSDVEEELAQ